MPVVTLTAFTTDGVLAQAAACREAWRLAISESGATGVLLLELRLDLLDDPLTGPEIVEALGSGVLVTARLAEDGGSGRLQDDECRSELLVDTCRAGADWVDLEWDAKGVDASVLCAKTVLSVHDFRGDRSAIESAVASMRSSSPDRIKVAMTANNLGDLAWTLDLDVELGERGGCFSMGELGRLSRWHPLLQSGSVDWIYCSGGALPVAPGQPVFTEFLEQARRFWEKPVGIGRFLALLGHPTHHSLSPRSFNAILADRSIPAVYLTLPCGNLSGLADLMGRASFAGFSVTAPHKVEALTSADTRSDEALHVGAANTLVSGSDSELRAENTDVVGVRNPLSAALQRVGLSKVDRALVIGAGGAARAGVAALQDLATAVFVTSRREEPGTSMARALRASFLSMSEAAEGGFGIVVNATPAGGPTQLGKRPLPDTCTQGSIACLDMNYRPATTPFLAGALANGAQAVGGLEMFSEQAREQWRLLLPEEVSAVAALGKSVEHVANQRQSDLVLVGGRGSGKSTVGRLLAEQSGCSFIDMDNEIESAMGMSIAEFFARHGEEEFRKRESDWATALSDDCVGSRVIATGGGAILTEAVRRTLRACGCVVFLDVTSEVALRRVQGSTTDRPALTQLDPSAEMEFILSARRPLYLETADFVVSADADSDEVVQKLASIQLGQCLLLGA